MAVPASFAFCTNLLIGAASGLMIPTILLELTTFPNPILINRFKYATPFLSIL
jgi:hypothetical protein